MFKSLQVGLALATVLAMQAVATAAVITRPFGTLGVVTGITDLNVDGTLYDVSFVILSNGVSPTFNNVFGVGEPPPTVPAFYNNRVGAQRAADAIVAAIPSFASGAYYSAFQDGIGPPTFGNIASAVYIPYRTIGDQPPSIQFSYISVRTSSFLAVWGGCGFFGVVASWRKRRAR